MWSISGVIIESVCPNRQFRFERGPDQGESGLALRSTGRDTQIELVGWPVLQVWFRSRTAFEVWSCCWTRPPADGSICGNEELSGDWCLET